MLASRMRTNYQLCASERSGIGRLHGVCKHAFLPATPKRQVLARAVDDKPSTAPVTDASASASTTSSRRDSKVLKSRKQRLKELAEAVNDSPTPGDGEAPDVNRPKRTKDAIKKGLECFQAAEYHKAIELFNLSLELPGSGAYRLSGSPREYSCPSETEENAALYNMACAYAKLGQADSSLTCLEAVLDNGFAEYDTIRSDPDLAVLRSGSGLEELLSRYDSPVSKLQKMFQKPEKLVSDTRGKPWYMW